MGWSLEEDDEFNLGLVTFEIPMEHAVKVSRQNQKDISETQQENLTKVKDLGVSRIKVVIKPKP